jgi:hypothetical protein
MRKIIAALSIVLLMSCKTYDISYDPSPKTEEAFKEQQEKSEDRYTLCIVLERSLKGHHVTIEAPAPYQFEPVGERVSYYEGMMPFTDGGPANAIKVNTAGKVRVRLNTTKIVIPAAEKVEYRYLYISFYKKKYLLEYSNREKQYYD